MSLITVTQIIETSIDVTLSAIRGKIQRVVNTGASAITVTYGSNTATINAGAIKDFWYNGTAWRVYGLDDNIVDIGTIIMYGGSGTPSNFLYCDGSAISRTTYATLFAKINTTYGVGDGSTTFNLPDYKGLVPKGIGNATINGRTKTGPTALGNKQEDQIQKFALRIRGVVKGTSAGASYVVGTSDSQVGTVSAATDNATNLITYAFEEYDSGGTPRIGTTTRDNSLGSKFFIRYQ